MVELDLFTWIERNGPVTESQIAAAVRDLPASSIPDVGGSSGIYACSLLADRPSARGTVVERPPVDVAARLLLAERGWDSRTEVLSRDIFVDQLPSGHDLHLYSQVLHDWDEPRVRHLLQASYDALPPGGWLVDHDAHRGAFVAQKPERPRT